MFNRSFTPFVKKLVVTLEDAHVTEGGQAVECMLKFDNATEIVASIDYTSCNRFYATLARFRHIRTLDLELRQYACHFDILCVPRTVKTLKLALKSPWQMHPPVGYQAAIARIDKVSLTLADNPTNRFFHPVCASLCVLQPSELSIRANICIGPGVLVAPWSTQLNKLVLTNGCAVSMRALYNAAPSLPRLRELTAKLVYTGHEGVFSVLVLPESLTVLKIEVEATSNTQYIVPCKYAKGDPSPPEWDTKPMHLPIHESMQYMEWRSEVPILTCFTRVTDVHMHRPHMRALSHSIMNLPDTVCCLEIDITQNMLLALDATRLPNNLEYLLVRNATQHAQGSPIIQFYPCDVQRDNMRVIIMHNVQLDAYAATFPNLTCIVHASNMYYMTPPGNCTRLMTMDIGGVSHGLWGTASDEVCRTIIESFSSLQ